MNYENNPAELRAEGSYVSGLIGALLGALVGAVAWCFVMQLGYIASLVGFAIGFVAEKGYTLFKGKVGKGKVIILVVAVIFGVVAGTFGAHYVDWYKAIAEYAGNAVANMGGYEIPVTYSDIPELILFYLANDSEYLVDVLKDVGMGLLFAFLGVFGILKNASRQAKPTQQTETM